VNSVAKQISSFVFFALIAFLPSKLRGVELTHCELTGIFKLGDSLRISLSHKQSGHLGWIEVGQSRFGITVVAASQDPPVATLTNGSETKEIRLKEVVVRPLNIHELVRSRPKTDEEIAFDATMVMSYERAKERRKELARRKREAQLKRLKN